MILLNHIMPSPPAAGAQIGTRANPRPRETPRRGDHPSMSTHHLPGHQDFRQPGLGLASHRTWCANKKNRDRPAPVIHLGARVLSLVRPPSPARRTAPGVYADSGLLYQIGANVPTTDIVLVARPNAASARRPGALRGGRTCQSPAPRLFISSPGAAHGKSIRSGRHLTWCGNAIPVPATGHDDAARVHSSATRRSPNCPGLPPGLWKWTCWALGPFPNVPPMFPSRLLRPPHIRAAHQFKQDISPKKRAF